MSGIELELEDDIEDVQTVEDDRFEEIMRHEYTEYFVDNKNKGGIYLELVDFNDAFAKLSIEPVIINNFDVSTIEDKERLNDLLYTRYEGDTLDVLPSCDGGHLRGEFNIGLICPECGTEVIAVTERPLESTLWITTPRGVKALIHPLVWAILSKPLTKSGCNILEWLVNSSYKPTSFPPELEKVKNLGFTRSLNYFYDNFDRIMEALFKYRIIKTTGVERENLRLFIQNERHKIFCNYIPIPSKLGFVTETTAGATYVDTTMAPAVEAIRTISSIETSITPTTPAIRERRVVKAIGQLAKYYYTFTGKPLGSKPGLLRQHVFGGRPHFSGRAVISSIYDNHKYDECVLPWGLAVMMLKLHIASKLLKRGFTPNQINKYIFEHVKQYSELLDEIFTELMNEGSEDGRSQIRIILHRNPSLDRLSAQALHVAEIRKDPKINTIGISTKILVAPNADFDGDELNVGLILDEAMWSKVKRLQPHTGVLDLNKPRSVSNNLKLPTPILSMIGNWLHSPGK